MRIFALVALVLLTPACKKAPPASLDAAYTPEPSDPAKEAPPPVVARVAQNFARVQFAYDSATLDTVSKAALSENAAILTANPAVKVEVQGHADERGTTDYNLALGDKRAAVVRAWLVTGGVGTSQIATVSYGEERPLSSGQGESVWAANRRAEFRITWSGDALVEGTTR
ncbi:MAG: OmpA family protein [Myxococcota bacterium]